MGKYYLTKQYFQHPTLGSSRMACTMAIAISLLVLMSQKLSHNVHHQILMTTCISPPDNSTPTQMRAKVVDDLHIPAVKPAVQLLQIQEVHPVPHSSEQFFAVFMHIFLPILSRSSFTSRTPDKDQKTSTFFSFKSYNMETFMSFAVIGFVHAMCSRSKKSASRRKWHVLVPLDGFP